MHQVIFGTDYPFLLGDLEGGKWIEDSEQITEKQKRKIFTQNMAEFLNIPSL